MQYSLLTLFALVVAVVAVTPEEHNEFIKLKRQQTQNNVPVNVAAMTNANGDVVTFDAKNVYQDSLAKGL